MNPPQPDLGQSELGGELLARLRRLAGDPPAELAALAIAARLQGLSLAALQELPAWSAWPDTPIRGLVRSVGVLCLAERVASDLRAATARAVQQATSIDTYAAVLLRAAQLSRTAPVARRPLRLRAIEAAGVRALLLICDRAHRAALKRLLRQACRPEASP